MKHWKSVKKGPFFFLQRAFFQRTWHLLLQVQTKALLIGWNCWDLIEWSPLTALLLHLPGQLTQTCILIGWEVNTGDDMCTGNLKTKNHTNIVQIWQNTAWSILTYFNSVTDAWQLIKSLLIPVWETTIIKQWGQIICLGKQEPHQDLNPCQMTTLWLHVEYSY